jgi:hypothetical protein
VLSQLRRKHGTNDSDSNSDGSRQWGESLPAEFALVGLQGNVNSNVGGDVVALDGRSSALTPGAGQIQVVNGLAANMALADVLLDE